MSQPLPLLGDLIALARAKLAQLPALLRDPAAFSWRAQQPLFSDRVTPAIAVAAYLVVIFALRAFVLGCRGGRALPGAKLLFAAHNFVLSAASAVMLGGAVLAIWQRIAQHPSGSLSLDSFEWLACEAPGARVEGTLYFWSYMYYLSKFYELLDTVFLAAKGSKLEFFQVYHHSVVVLMCYFWLESAQSLQFGGLIFNTFVHVIMYFYFGLREIGYSPAWRGLVTSTQIVQFVWSAFAFTYTMFLVHARGRSCAGTHALYFNFVFNMSLLYQFWGLSKKGDRAARLQTKQQLAEGGSATATAAPIKRD